MPSEQNRLATQALKDKIGAAATVREQQEELHISISAELLQELLTQKAIKACQVRCLNPETSDRLKSMCMDCCAKNLFGCTRRKATRNPDNPTYG